MSLYRLDYQKTNCVQRIINCANVGNRT